MNILLFLLHKFLCFLGFHHYHSLDEAKAVIKGPPGLKVKGRYCCRCHDLQVDEIDMNGEKSKPGSIKRI